jgi:V8-like Glu-specific endopeptidase
MVATDEPQAQKRRIKLRSAVAELGRGRSLVPRSALLTAVLAAIAAVLGVALLPGAGLVEGRSAAEAASGTAPAIGAVFTMSGGHLGQHFCSGSVVNSPSGNLVLTAAHCLSRGGQLAFVPGYSNGHEPFGVWPVTRVVVDQNWRSSSDPNDDFAFLIVHRPGARTSLQERTGAEAVGIGEPAGQKVTVTGYPDGLNTQISCRNTASAFGPSQFQFDCGGFTDGTSGSPFLTSVTTSGGDGVVIGVIGGYEQGGLTPSVSYAARFGSSMAALYKTAIAAAGR